jgi:apolipoprotein N-acyltransferase
MIGPWRNLCQQHPYWVALLSGFLVPLAYAPVLILPLFYLGFGTAFYLAWQHSEHLGRLFRLGWLFGFGQLFLGLYWIGEAFLVEAEIFLWLLPFAVTLLPAGLAMFSALAFFVFGASLAWLGRAPSRSLSPPSSKPLSRLAALLWLAVLWSLAEYGRATILTGFPWNLPGMAWGSWLYLAQPVNVLGVHGLGLLALISVSLMVSKTRYGWHGGLALLAAAFVYSGVTLHTLGQVAGAQPSLQILVVQPHLDQREKWLPSKRQDHIEKTFRLTQAGLAQAPNVGLVVWPETALPAPIDETYWFGARLRATLPDKTFLLTGAMRRQAGDDGYAYFNSAMLWQAGQIVQRSDKHHLVPFGEYLPMQSGLEALGLQQLTKLRGGYQSGPADARFSAPGLAMFAPLICYEAIFPGLSAGQPRPAWLANITNDGWFGAGLGPRQHVAHVRLRSIEQGLPLVRSANTGVSAAFDGRGRYLASVPLGEAGSFVVTLPEALPETWYARLGDVVFWGLWLATLAWILAMGWRRRL